MKTRMLLSLLALSPLAATPALSQAADHLHPAPAPTAPAAPAPTAPGATPNAMGGMMEMMMQRMMAAQGGMAGMQGPVVIVVMPGMGMPMDMMMMAPKGAGNAMQMPQAATPPQPTGYAQEMAAASAKMAAAMEHAPTDNPDQDFAMMMVPHHQGAIDMARIELKYGRDPMLRELATAIIAAQEAEIGLLQRWMAANAMAH